MKFSESTINIFPALVKAQAEIKNPIKNQVNKGVQGAPKYANLEDTLAEYVRPVLSKYGLALLQDLCNDRDGRVGVSTIIIHDSGEYIQTDTIYCDLVIPTTRDGKEILTRCQATGVDVTYLRRYSLNAALGINGDKDTDGSFSDAPVEEKPLTYETALDYTLGFGKHAGKPLREIYKSDRGYIEWLKGSDKTDDRVREAIDLIEVRIAEEQIRKRINPPKVETPETPKEEKPSEDKTE